MNVSVLDGVTIGDGSVIGAGTIVSKDVPPYAIVAGNPMKILRYRFSPDQIESLLRIRWWNWPDHMLPHVQSRLFDIDHFLDAFN